MEGPDTLSLIACQPIVAFRWSDSNQPSRYCVAEVENRNIRSSRSRRPPRALRPIFIAVGSSPMPPLPVGGVQSNMGMMMAAMSARCCSKSRNRRASFFENRATSRSVSSRSSESRNRPPSGNRFSVGPAGETVRPRCASRMSCQIASRSMLST